MYLTIGIILSMVTFTEFTLVALLSLLTSLSVITNSSGQLHFKLYLMRLLYLAHISLTWVCGVRLLMKYSWS